MDKIEILLKSNKKVFSLQDLAILWETKDSKKLIKQVHYYLKAKKLLKVYRGIYSLDESFNNYELSQKLVPLSYISLYTALNFHGLSFQYNSTIHAMALISKKYKVKDTNFDYHQVQDFIFYDELGLVKENNFVIASPERAICDSLYIYPDISFEHLDKINKEDLIKISLIYKNKRLEKDVEDLIKLFEIK